MWLVVWWVGIRLAVASAESEELEWFAGPCNPSICWLMVYQTLRIWTRCSMLWWHHMFDWSQWSEGGQSGRSICANLHIERRTSCHQWHSTGKNWHWRCMPHYKMLDFLFFVLTMVQNQFELGLDLTELVLQWTVVQVQVQRKGAQTGPELCPGNFTYNVKMWDLALWLWTIQIFSIQSLTSFQVQPHNFIWKGIFSIGYFCAKLVI